MTAQSIDRLALTRQKFGAKMYEDNTAPKEQHRKKDSIYPSCGWSACD